MVNTRWQISGRNPVRWIRAAAQNQTRSLHWWHRLDILLLVGLVVLVSLFLVLGTGILQIGDRLGVFDPSPVQPVPDKRILRNIRADIQSQPLLEATLHQGDGLIHISQQGRILHRFDPQTELWQTETPFASTQAISSEIVALRSGCGADPQSDRRDACPDIHSLWARSEAGGLARLQDDAWTTVLGDRPFMGWDGLPVEQADLTTAAVSADKAWLLVGTRDKGFGLYHTHQHRWLTLATQIQATMPASDVMHAVWWQDRFWLGGSNGLAMLAPGQLDETAPTLSVVQATLGKNITALVAPFPGDGLTLDATSTAEGAPEPDTGLWILGDHICQNQTCRWLAKLTEADADPTILMAEEAVYADLNLDDLIFCPNLG